MIKLLGANYNPGKAVFGVNEITLARALQNYPYYEKNKDILDFIQEQVDDIEIRKYNWREIATAISGYTGGSRSSLGRHLQGAGRPKPVGCPDCEAHHIIPYNKFEYSTEGQTCRRILREAGIINERGVVDINNSINGAWVSPSNHNAALHSEDYFKAVTKALDEVEKLKKAGIIKTQDQYQEEVINVLRSIGDFIEKNGFYPPK